MKIARRRDGLGAAVANNEASELLLNSAGELVVTTGGGVGGGLTDAQLRASPVPVSGTVATGGLTDAQLRASNVPVTVANFPATQPVSLATGIDVIDRAARLLGHVTIDNASLAVTGTFWQATQPVSLAAAVDVSDRAARLLGHVTVDNASLAVTGPLTDTQLRASAVPVSGTFFQATQPVSLATNTPDVTDRAGRLLGVVDTELPAAAALADGAANPTTPQIAADNMLWNGATWDRAKGDTTIGQRVGLVAAPLIVTATGIVSAAVTATLPAAGAGLFHYITRINIAQVAGTTAGAAAVPLVVTTTNIPGSLAITRPTAIAAGTCYETDIEPVNPIKSSVANTATTIVAPVHTNIIWRINVYYYTAP